MEKKLFFVLKPGAVLTETDGRVGIQLGDKLRYAETPAQAALLRALSGEPQALEAATAMLRVQGGSLPGDAATALAMAEFILDFTDFYDTGIDPPKKEQQIAEETLWKKSLH